ncbi:hypothetical protein [Croceicoccus sp. Ery5]
MLGIADIHLIRAGSVLQRGRIAHDRARFGQRDHPPRIGIDP